MEKNDDYVISQVRRFSRFYTNILGLLNQTILDSPYSLTEVRILLEIKRNINCTAAFLIEKLNVDRGYMSRILNRFESEGMITKRNSPLDGRVVFLYLTLKGKETMANLESKSEEQIQRLISHLKGDEKEKMADAMKYVIDSLSPGVNPINIRTYKPEDIEYIIKSHRELYEAEYGFTTEFGEYVEKYVVKFHESHDENAENIWIAEENGRPVGMIAIVKADDSTAQLRWFLIESQMRGKGLGHKLMKTVIDFCKEKNYKHVLLWTVNILEAARHLYKTYGFSLTESVENNTWTDSVIKEERWDLDL